MSSSQSAKRSVSVWLVPLLVFLVMAGLTTVVWRQQVDHKRQLLTRHAEDVCMQASRRLEVYIDMHLSVAQMFARRWATHEGRDFSRVRFDEFASVLVEQMPAFASVGRVSADRQTVWTIPASQPVHQRFVDRHGQLLDEARDRREPWLSEPVVVGDKQIDFFAVLPLYREQEFLGHLLMEFRASQLFEELFHHRIRSEFQFYVQDGTRTVYRYEPEGRADDAELPAVSSRVFEVHNRHWRLTVSPRAETVRLVSWGGSVAVPILGLILSSGLSALSYLLILRITAYRRARDEALHEVAERRKAEESLRVSEARYRSVFDSATDGLLVLDPDGRIEEANEAACTMHGYPHGELEGKDVRLLIADDYQHKLDAFMALLAKTGTVNLESVDVRQDGTRVNVEVKGTRFVRQGKPAVLAILTDVTQRTLVLQQQQQLSRRVLMIQEEERARISRDLHDGLGQLLTALRFEIDWLHKQAGDGKAVGTAFAKASDLLETSAAELRRLCKGLRPPLLDDLGLEPAIASLAAEFQEHTGIEIELAVELDEDLAIGEEVALCAYRVAQEALTNVQRHAAADRISIALGNDARELTLSVYDDGRGFDPADPETMSHFGIAGMRERAKLVNGTIELRSAPQEGTRVVLRIPRDPQPAPAQTTANQP